MTIKINNVSYILFVCGCQEELFLFIWGLLFCRRAGAGFAHLGNLIEIVVKNQESW